MTRYKFLKITLSIACIMTVILSSALCVSAASDIKYTNKETGYKIVIKDEADLLTSDEENKLIEDMKAVTAYGNAAFWTTNDYAQNEIEQARIKRRELFDFDSGCIFVINMKIRKLTIQSYGDINKFVTDSIARSITNNVSPYATYQKYYECAKDAFSQINTVCERKQISEPLKVSGYVVISIMSGLLIAVTIAFSKKQNSLICSYDLGKLKPYNIKGGFTGPITAEYVSDTIEHRPPSYISFGGSGGSGCSSCSSCSSGSSCSSCSSGSSCGGCGSGGSSSF